MNSLGLLPDLIKTVSFGSNQRMKNRCGEKCTAAWVGSHEAPDCKFTTEMRNLLIMVVPPASAALVPW